MVVVLFDAFRLFATSISVEFKVVILPNVLAIQLVWFDVARMYVCMYWCMHDVLTYKVSAVVGSVYAQQTLIPETREILV